MGQHDELTGRELRFWPGFPFWGALTALIGIGLFAGGVLEANRHLLIFSALPLALTVGQALGRPCSVSLSLEEDGINWPELNQFMDYADVQSLRLGGAARRASDPKLRGTVSLATGTLRIDLPRRGDIPHRELYLQVLDRIPLATGAVLEGSLQAFQHQELSAFGPERVFAFRVRDRSVPKSRRSDRWIWPLLVLVGIGWAIAGAQGREYEGWIGGAIVSGCVGVIGWAVSAARGRESPAKLGPTTQSGLVIAPSGIALALGDSKGKLRWDELVSLELRSGTRNFALSHGPTGIVLAVKGAEIIIPDVFERPLAVIFRQMELYWRGPE